MSFRERVINWGKRPEIGSESSARKFFLGLRLRVAHPFEIETKRIIQKLPKRQETPLKNQ